MAKIQLRPIAGYEGFYSVSSDGRVYSHPSGFNANRHGKWLKTYEDTKGYQTVTLTRNYERKSFKVHLLVAAAFTVKTSDQINHIDGNKRNNDIANLEWCTNRQNTIHAYQTGLRKLKHSKKKILELLSYGNSQHQVAVILDMDQSTISRIASNKSRRYAK